MLVLCLVFIVSNLLQYFLNEDEDQDDPYFGYVIAYLVILTWDAFYKCFICIMLFRSLWHYLKGKELIGVENPSYDMKQNLLCKMIIVAVIACLDAILVFVYIITSEGIYECKSFADFNLLSLYLIFAWSLFGGFVFMMAILWALHSIIGHASTKLMCETEGQSQHSSGQP